MILQLQLVGELSSKMIMAFHYSHGNKDICSHIIYTYWYFLSLLLQVISSQPFYTASIDLAWKHRGAVQRYGGECGREGPRSAPLSRSWSTSSPIVRPWVPAWMGTFFSFDKLLTSTYLPAAQTCWPWHAISMARKKRVLRITYSDELIPGSAFVVKSCGGGRKFAKLQPCHWVKLYLMALFWETRSMCLVSLREHPSSPPQPQPQKTNLCVSSRWASLPKTEQRQGTPPSICQKLLKLWLVIIYGVLLWSLIADARSGHLHAFPSPALVSRPFIRRR